MEYHFLAVIRCFICRQGQPLVSFRTVLQRAFFLLTSAISDNIITNFLKYTPLATCFGGDAEPLLQVLRPFSMTGDWNEHNWK
jgi:hypothetical protein